VVALIRNRRALMNEANAEYVGIAKSCLAEDYTGWAERIDLAGNDPDKPKGAREMVERIDARLPI
jgi:hypothetical protein